MDYTHARREGLREFALCNQAHTDPYLPVLEEKVPNLAQLSRLSLGVMSVPLDRVVGSVSQGRSYAFARNFMPILESGSEFSSKWERLYESVKEKGVNVPITALEYMGYYYVIEGNKRTSVMKSLASEEIEADVTRVIPERTEDPENIAYFEYCTFTRETGFYSLLFTRPGSYAKLVTLPGVRAGETWTQDEILSLRKLYRYFSSAYSVLLKEHTARGEKMQQVGDAFLVYLIAFNYQAVRDEDLEKTTERVRLMAREFELEEKVELVMASSPQSAPSVPLISALFRPSKVRAAFLFTRSVEESAWNYWHNLGRLDVETRLGDRVETAARIVPSRGDFNPVIEELRKEGYTTIFATSPVMQNSSIEPSLEHPGMRFFCCSLLSPYTTIPTYYIRFYEAKFLMGMAAGVLAKNGMIGYIADFPIFGAPSAANAFALGARMVNPDAKIYLNWFSASYFDAEKPFLDPEIRVICNRDITAPGRDSRDYGLYVRDGDEIRNMATLIPQWGPFYRMIIERQQNGSLRGPESRDSATNYWWGIGSGVLDVAFSARFDPYALRMIHRFRQGFLEDAFSPFEGELRDQSGALRCEADRRLTPAEILCMDYLLDNIIGDIPSVDQVIPSARPLVRLQGIHGEWEPRLSSFSWNRK